MAHPINKVFIIEYNKADADLVQTLLSESEQKFKFIVARTLKEALAQVEKNRPDVILLDLSLPDSEGLHSFHLLNQKVPHIPIIILSNLTNKLTAENAIAAGVQDYLIKGNFNSESLLRAINYAIKREEKLSYIDHHDELTQLSNRAVFESRMNKAIPKAIAAHKKIAFLYIDINNFNKINNVLGHKKGEKLIVELPAGPQEYKIEEVT